MKWLISLILALAIITGIFFFGSTVIYDYSNNDFIKGLDKYNRVPIVPLEESPNYFYLISYDSDYLDIYNPTLMVQYPIKFMYRVNDFYFLFELSSDRKQDWINYIYKNVHEGVANIPIIPEFFKVSVIADVDDDSVSFNLINLPPETMFFNYPNYDYTLVEVYNNGSFVNNSNPNFVRYFEPFVSYIDTIPLALVFTNLDMSNVTDEFYIYSRLLSSHIYEFANTSYFELGNKLNEITLATNTLGGMPELPVYDPENNSGIQYVASYFVWVVEEISYVFRYAGAVIGGIL